MKRKIALVCLIVSLVAPTKLIEIVKAFDASSTNFFVRQDLADIAGNSTSTNFNVVNHAEGIGGNFASSTTFKLMSGIIRALFQPIAPNYTLIHYHWRNDNGTEATASSATNGVEDTPLGLIVQDTSKRLRIEATNKGGTIRSFSAQQFRLEYGLLATTCSAISSWGNIGDSTSTWAMATSTNIADGTDTTNIATTTGGVSDENNLFVTPNSAVKTTSNQTGNILVPSDSFVELEYSIKPLSSSTAGSTYCFRVTNAGSVSNFTYNKYPTTTVTTSGQIISLLVNPTVVNLPGLSSGIAVTATSTVTVTMSGGASGYSLQVSRNSGTSTLASSTITFPDATSWSSGSGCSGAEGNGTTSPSQTLSFRVEQSGTNSSYCSIWWGANDTDGIALYGGFPTSTQTIVNATSSNNSTSTTTLRYRVDAPPTQIATNYTGGITITALANP